MMRAPAGNPWRSALSDETQTTASKPQSSAGHERVVVRPYPKVIFFWPTWITSLVAAIVMQTVGESVPAHLGTVWMRFFAFNLLFSYLVDVAGVWPSFWISAAVSVFLVTTYLSRAVSPRFGFRQAGLAQLVFLVGFALANMWDGMTGLSITVTGIATLAAIMQITAKVDWTQALSRDKLAA